MVPVNLEWFAFVAAKLLIIDIQNDYFPGGKMELVGSIEAAAAAARLLAAFRKQAWLIFPVQHIAAQPNPISPRRSICPSDGSRRDS